MTQSAAVTSILCRRRNTLVRQCQGKKKGKGSHASAFFSGFNVKKPHKTFAKSSDIGFYVSKAAPRAQFPPPLHLLWPALCDKMYQRHPIIMQKHTSCHLGDHFKKSSEKLQLDCTICILLQNCNCFTWISTGHKSKAREQYEKLKNRKNMCVHL